MYHLHLFLHFDWRTQFGLRKWPFFPLFTMNKMVKYWSMRCTSTVVPNWKRKQYINKIKVCSLGKKENVRLFSFVTLWNTLQISPLCLTSPSDVCVNFCSWQAFYYIFFSSIVVIVARVLAEFCERSFKKSRNLKIFDSLLFERFLVFGRCFKFISKFHLFQTLVHYNIINNKHKYNEKKRNLALQMFDA